MTSHKLLDTTGFFPRWSKYSQIWDLFLYPREGIRFWNSIFENSLSYSLILYSMESIELIIFRYRQCFDQLTLNIRSVRSNNSFKIHIRSINDLKTRHRYRCGNLTRGQTLEEMRKRLDRSSTRYTNLGSNFSTCCFNILFSHFVTIFSPDGRWPRV